MSEKRENQSNSYPLWIVTIFVLSRLLFYLAGVGFDASGLSWYWQYLDVELLKADLLKSTFYQHAQPPLFNLFLGLVLKLFPQAYEWAFAVIYKGMSLALYYMLFRTLKLLRVKPGIAFLSATLFILTPTVVLYENWLFYTWPAAVLLLFAAYQLLLYGQTGSVKRAALYILAITAICLMRSLFHLVFFAAALVPLFFLHRTRWKKPAVTAAIGLLIVSSVFLKNLLLFGFFGTSSWMGMNLWKIVPIGGKEAQLADSAIAQVEPFAPLRAYPAGFHEVPGSYAAIPAVADAYRENGMPNLNHYGYIAVSDAYREEALGLIKQDPGGYLYMVSRAWALYGAPAADYPLLNSDNVRSVGSWIAITSPTLSRPIVYGALILNAVFLIAAARRRSAFKLPAAEWACLTFCIGTVFYVALLGNLMEHGENMRFRLQTDPLLLTASLCCLSMLSRASVTRPDTP